MSVPVATEVAPVNHGDIVAKISWKMPISYVIGTLITLFTALKAEDVAVYRFNLSRNDRFQIPDWSVNAPMLCWILTAVMAVISIYSIYRAIARKPAGVVVAVIAAISVVFTLLTWQGGGSAGSITLTATLAAALALSTPLIFGSLSGVGAERSGVVNVAIEGQLLTGAFAGVVVASASGSVWFGLVAAPIAGALM